MRIAKRIFLFVTVNILVVATISLLLSFLGVQPYLQSYGLNYSSLIVFCLVWGFGGAFISLALSRIMAKFLMGVRVLDPNRPSNPKEAWLIARVHEYSRAAGLPKLPQVGIYHSPELNAFATGPTKSRALVAVSSGLLQNMSEPEVEGVLGHEVAHVANGDMVTMTLVQGVVNAFVMFLARVIAFALSQNAKEESQPMIRMGVTFVLEILLGFLGFMVVAYFSRLREYRADKGGASLAGREKMRQALQGLQRNLRVPTDDHAPSLAALKISGKPSRFAQLFSTHPPLEERIRRL